MLSLEKSEVAADAGAQADDDALLREEFLERMERQGNRLIRLVENLLTTSRLENDQLSISVGRVLFEDVCRETVDVNVQSNELLA